MTSRFTRVSGILAVAVLAALSWFGWMGRDEQYLPDGSGPYTAFQVVGCAGTLLAILVGAVLLGVPPAPAAAAMTVSFTAAWIVAAADDTTGLWAVGAIMVFGGLAAVSALVAIAADLLRARFRRAATTRID